MSNSEKTLSVLMKKSPRVRLEVEKLGSIVKMAASKSDVIKTEASSKLPPAATRVKKKPYEFHSYSFASTVALPRQVHTVLRKGERDGQTHPKRNRFKTALALHPNPNSNESHFQLSPSRFR